MREAICKLSAGNQHSTRQADTYIVDRQPSQATRENGTSMSMSCPPKCSNVHPTDWLLTSATQATLPDFEPAAVSMYVLRGSARARCRFCAATSPQDRIHHKNMGERAMGLVNKVTSDYLASGCNGGECDDCLTAY